MKCTHCLTSKAHVRAKQAHVLAAMKSNHKIVPLQALRSILEDWLDHQVILNPPEAAVYNSSLSRFVEGTRKTRATFFAALTIELNNE